MNTIGKFVKENRKKAGLTLEEFLMNSGLDLHFVRDLEQGKKTVCLDKVISMQNAYLQEGKESFLSSDMRRERI